MVLSAREKAEKLLIQAEAGEFLQEKRKESGHSLAQAGEVIGCSPTYLSEIERGLKLPSDVLISRISRFYNIDETELFNKYRKVPLSVLEEVEKYPGLQKTLLEITKNKHLTEEQKHGFYEQVYKIYHHYVRNGDSG